MTIMDLAQNINQKTFDFCHQIKAIREHRKLSHEELGNKLGCSAEMIYDIESGAYDLTLTEIRHICLALQSEMVLRMEPIDKN